MIRKINKKCFNLLNQHSSIWFLSPTPSLPPFSPDTHPSSVLTKAFVSSLRRPSPLTCLTPLQLTASPPAFCGRVSSKEERTGSVDAFHGRRGWTSFICIYTTSSFGGGRGRRGWRVGQRWSVSVQKCLFVWPFISTLHIHEFPVRMREKS